MTTTTRNKLRNLLTQLQAGAPLTTSDLSDMGVSHDLAVYYAKTGWLKRLARGVYCRTGDALSLYPSLCLLQRQFEGFYVGGKTALDWHGVKHYLLQQPVLQLYGLDSAKLPQWFSDSFPSHYNRKRLFNETPSARLHIVDFENTGVQTSTPERAFLEMLSEVGVRQTLQEAKELTESCYTLRPAVLFSLLQQCVSVKTINLCKSLGKKLAMPWYDLMEE